MTVVGYGAQIQVLLKACAMAKDELGVSCEIIDLRTIIPWDVDTVAEVRYYTVMLSTTLPTVLAIVVTVNQLTPSLQLYYLYLCFLVGSQFLMLLVNCIHMDTISPWEYILVFVWLPPMLITWPWD